MKGLYIDPKSQTIQDVILNDENQIRVLSVLEIAQLILEVDFVQEMWYNEDYDLYCGDQQELSRYKKLHWFKYNIEDSEQYICNNAVLIPKNIEGAIHVLPLGSLIEWVDEYTPPIQDFII
jgi:hypothetical protein